MKKRLQEFLHHSFGEDFITKNKVIAISCLQFGDTGKGKFVDLFAEWADVIIRPTGGNNAGHTIIYKGQELVLHLIPCGITNPDKINIIGSNTVIDPLALIRVLAYLQALGITCDNLRISLKAKVILPSHIIMDVVGESKAGKGRIGTTGKGIGPCYTDHVARRGVVMGDLLNLGVLTTKIKKAFDYHQIFIRECGGYKDAQEMLAKMQSEERSFAGIDGELFNVENIASVYSDCGNLLRHMIEDTDTLARESVGHKNILLEGAQGYLLSIDHGTYPFVTSSDCSPAGMAKGAGLKESDIDLSFGIIKGFYMTRVGKGPFPTEMGGESSEAWCNGFHVKADEICYDGDSNETDEFLQGVALRRAAGEYGATTGRPRRTGWIDLPLLRYALDGGATDIILTKLDVLTGLKKIKVCYAYQFDPPSPGSAYNLGNKLLPAGAEIEKAIMDLEVLQYCKPLYQEFPGWEEDIRQVRLFDDLPVNLKKILDFIFVDGKLNAMPKIISVGPGPEETIFI